MHAESQHQINMYFRLRTGSHSCNVNRYRFFLSPPLSSSDTTAPPHHPDQRGRTDRQRNERTGNHRDRNETDRGRRKKGIDDMKATLSFHCSRGSDIRNHPRGRWKPDKSRLAGRGRRFPMLLCFCSSPSSSSSCSYLDSYCDTYCALAMNILNLKEKSII